LHLLPLATRGFQRGSRLHHWLPRPSLVPNFPRTGVEASTSCPMYLRHPSNHKGWYCTSPNCSIYCECVSLCLSVRVMGVVPRTLFYALVSIAPAASSKWTGAVRRHRTFSPRTRSSSAPCPWRVTNRGGSRRWAVVLLGAHTPSKNPRPVSRMQAYIA
jgi:hypothetical protein